ncbi:MAG: hypothetical protein ACXVQR_02990 [Solirubrobacteraceae bacterium]
MATLVALCALLIAEAVALCFGQRRLFWTAVDATGSRLLGYILAMPGTVLHESAHYLACVTMRVPVGRQVRSPTGGRARVRLFYPQRDRRTGAVTLGSVPHAATDPLRGALIAVAPLLLVPPLLVVLALLVTGTGDPAQITQRLAHLPPWKLLLLGYLSFSCGLAAFPSRGDDIGALGGLALLAAGAASVAVIVSHGGQAELIRVTRAACLLLTVPALASTISLLVLGAVARGRRRR